MAPPVTRLIVHNKPGNRTSWGHHVTLGLYIGPSLYHYRCIQCYMPTTGIVRTTYSLQYILNAFSLPKTTTEDYLQQVIEDIIEIIKYTPKSLPFSPYGNAKKNAINQIAHISQRSIAQPRIQILPLPSLLPQIHNENLQPAEITSILAPAPKVGSFFNLQGCKHKSQHLHRLQEISLTHILAWIISHDSKHLQNIRSYPRFSKPGKHKRHPSKFNTVYAVPHATLGGKYAPKQHSNLLPTIYSNYHMLYISTISRVKRKL